MRARPILFSGPMVRALLAGTKTQTRRVVKPQPAPCEHKPWPGEYQPNWVADVDGWHCAKCGNGLRLDSRSKTGTAGFRCPYGVPGDRLWVREAWSTHAFLDAVKPSDLTIRSLHYWADGDIQTGKRRPGMFMPRWASRLTLEVTGVRVERLQDISRGDAMAEGCPFPNMAQGDDPRQWYAQLWEQINGAGSWDANPWVWCVEFPPAALTGKAGKE